MKTLSPALQRPANLTSAGSMPEAMEVWNY